MSPEKQRIAIAEACGWTDIGTTGNHGVPYGLHPVESKRNPRAMDSLPDYLNDLNAMHEAEETITDWWAYSDHLEEVTGNSSGLAPIHNRLLIRATAAQRAEAFLRTIGKWEP